MKKLSLLVMAVVGLYSCQNDDATADSSFEMKAVAADYTAASLLPKTVVSTDITTNTTWDNDHVWVIQGVVAVTGGTLTIEPGTFIIADSSVSGTTGVLVVSKGGRINAVGLNPDGSCNPIVFTSYNLLDNNDATTALPGDFGGVVLLGEATVNTGLATNVIEGLNLETPAADFQYGGSSDGDDSGVMSYVRIEFAGRVIGDPEAGNEINGLTLGGVGSGTTLDHIQVSYGRDDAFEFFGGTVNATHLIAFAQDDDAFDFDFGYTGYIDRALALANKNATHSQSGTSPDSNGIELDNNAGSTNSLPFTQPTVQHLSIVGVQNCTDSALYENGIHVRRSGRLTLLNSTVTGYGAGSNRGIRIDATGFSSIADSFFDDVEVVACSTPAITAGILGVTASTGAPSAFGTTQPFYVVGTCGTLNFATSSRTSGAFADNSGDWTSCWAKFCDFDTVYE